MEDYSLWLTSTGRFPTSEDFLIVSQKEMDVEEIKQDIYDV